MSCSRLARLARLTPAALLLLIPSRDVHGQAVTRIANEDIQNALLQTHRNASNGVAFRMAQDLGAQFILNRRTAPSEVELHCAWDDLLMVRSGVGELEHGNKLQGLSRFSAGEWRATALVKARRVPLTAGDIVRIPAGHGHTVRPLGDAPLVYVIVKVKSDAATPCGSLPNRGG